MILSIRDNWKDAEAEHNDYVNARVRVHIDRYETRFAMDEDVVAFLKDVVRHTAPADIEALLKTIPEFRKVRETLADPVAQNDFVLAVQSIATTAASPATAGQRAAAKFRKNNPVPGIADFYARLAAHEKRCGDDGSVALFHRCLADEVTSTGKKPKNFIKDLRDPYLDGYDAREIVDWLTVKFLSAVCNDIGKAAFSTLEHTVTAFRTAESQCLNKKQKDLFHANLKAVFDYDRFTTKDTPGWNAYSLCKRSRTRTCPYCNQAYAFTVFRPDGEGGFRPTLDHFLSKDRFPHLALSLNNLIPSCYTCNSNLKGTKDFYKDRHLHPLYDTDPIRFSIELPGMALVDLMNDFERLKSRAQLKVTSAPGNDAARNSMETFLIEERYASHHDEAIEFASLRLDLGSGRLEEISDLLGGRSEARLLRFDRARYSQTLLGKMYADIYDNFKR